MSWCHFSVVTGVPSPPSAMKILSFLFALLLVIFHGAAGKVYVKMRGYIEGDTGVL